MENNTNYSVPGIQNKPGNKLKRGFKRVFIILAIFAGFIVSYYFIVPEIFPKSFRGTLQNIQAFPSVDGKCKLWIQTDGTFRTTSRRNMQGSYALRTEGWFCRTYSYVYDPIAEDMVNGFKTSYDDLPPVSDIIYDKGKIWVVNSLAPGVLPAINVYSSENYLQELNIQSFCEKNKELSSGIENVSVDLQRPVRLRISTKDGRELVYSISDDKFFASSIDLEKYYREIDTTSTAMFALGNEKNSDKRKKLYFLKGPKYELCFSYSWVEAIVEQNSAFKKLTASEMLPDKVFIEGGILYSDDEIAVIVHQDNVGKNADRMLTCVDKSGKELWTKQQTDLFDVMKGKEDDSITEMSYMITQLSAQRFGDVVIFIFKPEGAIGFNLVSGKKLWEYDD